jgi:hypothetical protein
MGPWCCQHCAVPAQKGVGRPVGLARKPRDCRGRMLRRGLALRVLTNLRRSSWQKFVDTLDACSRVREPRAESLVSGTVTTL